MSSAAGKGRKDSRPTDAVMTHGVGGRHPPSGPTTPNSSDTMASFLPLLPWSSTFRRRPLEYEIYHLIPMLNCPSMSVKPSQILTVKLPFSTSFTWFPEHFCCAMKNSCSLPAATSMFGDPCPGTLKYLEAHYQCVPEKSTTSSSSILKPSPPPIVNPSSPHNTTSVRLPTTPLIIRPSTTTTTTTTSTTESTTVSTTPSTAWPTDDLPEVHTEPVFKPPYEEVVPTDPGPQDLGLLYCAPVMHRGILWNWTRAGDQATARCPKGATGDAHWQCDLSGDWATPRPDLSGCTSPWVYSLQDRVREGHPVVNIASELATMTQAKPLFGGDVIHTVDIIGQLVSHLDDRIAEFSDDRQRHQVVKELLKDPAQERIQAEESAKPQPGATIGRDASSDPVVLNPNIDIPKYDGTEDPRPWIESLEEIGFLYHWADYIISRYAAMNMTGSAKTWLNLHKASFTSWENIKIRLIQDFSLDANKEELRMKLNRMQHWNEPAIRFAEDILVLCNKVDPAMEEETKIEHVIGGLKKEYSFALYLNPPKTTDDLLVVCKKMDYFEKKYRERVEKSRNLYNGPRYSRPQQQSRYVPPTAARNYQTTSRPQAPVSNNYKNDSPPTPRQYRNNFPQPSTPRRPYNPNFVPKPNLQRNTYNKSQEVSKNRTEDGRPICFKCNKPGHVARYCRVKFIRILEEDPADTQEKVEEKCQMNETSEKSGPRLYADIGTFEALVDTGADLSVVDLRTALDTGHGISKLAKICAGPDGKKLDMVGNIFLNIKIDDETLSHNFVILKTHLRTLILGRDFLKKMNAKIDCKQETIKYDLTNNHDEINFEMLKIKSAKDSIVPECSMKLIKALVETEDGEYIIEESSKMFQTNGLRLARSLINVINRETHIWITNPYPRPLKIMKNQTLAFGSSPAKINVSREREVEKNEEPRFQINENLSPKEQKELKQVLERYGDLFSSRLGRTNLAKHRIDTEDAKPIKHKPYRVSAKERDIIKEQIDEMLTEGIIRPSSSPWSFPVILVKKRDGKYRFCVDYRKLNNVTVKDVYPIPRIDEVMDTLQGSTHFSAIDLRSGYWQVEVEERDKEKTAFTTAHGLYEFNVMPFGLCNAPATFERNMENMLGNLRWQICLCYLDDVIIYSPDFPTHLKRLEAVFRCFRESNLRLNDKKCRFDFEELEILGYITSKHGIKPAEHNIKAVRNFPRPKKVKEVQSFLGMCSYYRKFIKDFSKIADPLTNLIKKSVSFTWTERQEEAFQTLKTALLSPPILGHFNPNAPTYVHTDASNIGIGATLVQDIGGEEKVISYLSRTLSKAEQNYSTTEKECLAVVWSMSKLRPYLYGRHFKIVTDHHALCWLKNLKDPTGRLARWALKIQEYDFDIIHKSGKKHLDADGLSRGPLPETDWDEDFERLFLNQITDEEDKFIESVKKNLNGSRRSIAQNFKEEDGCLFKKNPNPEGRAWLLVVPENKKREIMKEYHNHMSNGHLGVARTMYRIKSKYFWPSMLKDVSEFVKTCHLCQSRKGSNQLPSGLLQPIPPANFPFERIGIDFVGPLPSTKNRKKWIIVLSDYYTRYAETRAVSEATVKEVSKFLVEDIFLRHGAPQYLISDRGSQFTSNLMKEVMKTCKIKHCFTTSYHPQTNGLTERLNRTLINMLSMYVNTDQKNWDEILPFITHAYNTTIQETTGYSPFFLMFGREPTSLLDDRNISVDIDKDDYDEYIKHHLDKINRTRKLVINNTIKTQERMKKNYDKKHMERSYEPGELVAVWTPIRKIGKCEKLLRKYFGPYRILKKLSNVNYLIEPKDNPGQDPLIVHVSRIKPYFERIDEWVVDISNNLLNASQGQPWADLPSQDQRQVAAELLRGMEDNALLLADTRSSDLHFKYSKDNVLVAVDIVEMHKVEDITLPPPDRLDSGDSVFLPAEALLENSRNGLSKVVFVSYNPMLGRMLEPQSYLDTTVINSRIVSVSLGRQPVFQLSQPVVVTFKHLQEVNVSNPICVYWSYENKDWSEDGCRVQTFNRSHTSCACSHLTNFAVLMDIRATKLIYSHEKVLEILSYAGCSISIICLIFAILTFHFFRVLKSDRTTIHKNLCFCLLVAEVLFVAGVHQTAQPVVCSVIAGLLHYFFLAAFSWMFLEGFQLYVMLIEVFETEKSRVKYYYAAAYSAPAVIVMVSALVDSSSYGTPDYCWLRADNYFILSFVGPVIFIVLANFVFLSIALYMMCKHSGMMTSVKSKDQTKLSSIKTWVRGAVVLVFLLGLTWSFGLFYLNEQSVIMAYLFVIFNSLQGLFIFIFHCIYNDKVQKEYQKYFRRGENWLPICLHKSKDAHRRPSLFINSNGTAQPTSGDLSGPTPGIRRSCVRTHVRVGSKGFHVRNSLKLQAKLDFHQSVPGSWCHDQRKLHPYTPFHEIMNSWDSPLKTPGASGRIASPPQILPSSSHLLKVRTQSQESPQCQRGTLRFVPGGLTVLDCPEYTAEKLAASAEMDRSLTTLTERNYGHLSERTLAAMAGMCPHRQFADHIYETIDDEAHPSLYPQLPEHHIRTHSCTSRQSSGSSDNYPLIARTLPHTLRLPPPEGCQSLDNLIEPCGPLVMAVLDGERVVCRLQPQELADAHRTQCHKLSQLSTDC
ncbi:hypothetical protein LAZ67_3006074 [Cordylochernes scorpioides]|uniref:RNA-directed DNA polymerase n=1 Tax=Cordylochernes scorpioides TaxID=51811 RepID=A0ABY6KB23_9ARAC|nr:hypothetical protein LAZ67_3006074 [Cordylochernes scorpioides]